MVGSQSVLDSVVCQIVPCGDNPYVIRFGEGEFRDWAPPEVAFRVITAWRESGREVIVHSRLCGVRAVGESRGLSRFVVGGGVSLFVFREVGLLPVDAELDGAPLGGMVVTFAVDFPNPGGRTAAYHILPAEYLADPELPGLGPGLSRDQLLYQLPGPPIFHIGSVVDGLTGVFNSIVYFDASPQELDEGSLTFFSQILRGPSYRRLRGLPPV